MTREKFTKEVDKILKEINKVYPITSEEIDEGYSPNQCLYYLKDLPEWLFAIWDVDYLDDEPDGLYVFCEHKCILNKFKIGRCHKDHPYTSISEYISDITDIVNNEAYNFYQSNHMLEDDEMKKIEDWEIQEEFNKRGK